MLVCALGPSVACTSVVPPSRGTGKGPTAAPVVTPISVAPEPAEPVTAAAPMLPLAEWGDVYRGISLPDARAATRRAFSSTDCVGSAFTLYEAGRLCPCILREQWFDQAFWTDDPFCPAGILRFGVDSNFDVSFQLTTDEVRAGEEIEGRVSWTNVTTQPRPLVLFRDTPARLEILRSDGKPIPLVGRPCMVVIDLVGLVDLGLGVVLAPGGSLTTDVAIATRRSRSAPNPCRIEDAGPLPKGRYLASIVPGLLHDPVRPKPLPFRVK